MLAFTWRLGGRLNTMRVISISIFIPFIILLVTLPSNGAETNVKKLIFEERRIEGKIRRPQLVLIKAEQRPEFDPMVIQSLGKTGNIVGSVDTKILERSPYDRAFKFRGKRIDNYIP